MEAHLFLGRLRHVVAAQKGNEIVNVPVSPHPRREPAERRHPRRLVRLVPYMSVNGGSVWPVRLHRHDREAVTLDQSPGNGGAGTIELRGAMRRFAEEDDPR